MGVSKGFRHPRHHAQGPQHPQLPTPPPPLARTNITPHPLAGRSYQPLIEPPAGRCRGRLHCRIPRAEDHGGQGIVELPFGLDLRKACVSAGCESPARRTERRDVTGEDALQLAYYSVPVTYTERIEGDPFSARTRIAVSCWPASRPRSNMIQPPARS